MKKRLLLIFVFVICLLLTACAATTNSEIATGPQDETFTLELNDGTVKQMTIKEIVDIYENDGRTYAELLDGALIYGTGIVSSVGDITAQNWTYPDKRPCAWGHTVGVNNGSVIINTFFAPSDNYEKLYKGDKVVFQGHLSVSYGKIYVGTHYQMRETYLRYAG